MSKFLEYEKLAEEQWWEHERENKNCSDCKNWKIDKHFAKNPEFKKLVKTYQMLDKYQRKITRYQIRIKHLLNIKNACSFYNRYDNFSLLWNTFNRKEDLRTGLIKEIEEIAKKHV